MQHRLAIAIAVALLAGLYGGALRAEETTSSKPKCEVAEVNPVTGHVMCIRPLGATVEPPPEQNLAADCEPGDDASEDWSWSSKCRPAGAAE